MGFFSVPLFACFVVPCLALNPNLVRTEISADDSLLESNTFEQYKIHAAPNEEDRGHWENVLSQLRSSFRGRSLASPGEQGQEYSIRGKEGLCQSCQSDGRIYVATNDTDNQDSGALTSVLLAGTPGQLPKEDLYAIDEYRMGAGTTPFRWGDILCKTWFSNMCLQGETKAERRNHWNRKLLSRWAKLIPPGSNAIDIGANIGDTTVEMAIRAKETVAFEANPKAALFCQTHSLLNPQLNIKVQPIAVSTEDGTMQLNVDCGGCNSGPVQSREWVGTVISVPQKRLDKLLLHDYGEAWLKKLSFIKIDTEGFDKTLLRTYKPLLSISKPTFWVEWFDPYWHKGAKDEISEGSKDLFAAIHEIGYVPLNPATGKVVTPESRNGVPDLLLLPADKVPAGGIPVP